MNLFVISCLAFLSVCGWANAQPAPESENTGANKNITRWSSGEILYQTAKDKTKRGSERWTILVHPDATRTLITYNDIFARNVIMNVVMRVSASFRPIEAYTAYWNDGGLKGAGTFRVTGNQMTAVIDGPSGHFTQQVFAPDRFSLLTHPLAPDGWHGGTYDKKIGGAQHIGMLNIDAISTPGQPVLASVFEQTWELLGEEKISVPAGTFPTEHYRANDFDVWVTGPDRVLVKYLWPQADREYLLVDYKTGH